MIVSSDNGPTYAGGVDYDFFDSNGPLRGLKGSLFEGGIRVPMVVRWPGRVAPGSTTDHASAFQDVMPTLMEITGGEATGGGLSFLPVLTGGQQEEHEYLYWEHGPRQALRTGQWKGLRRHLKKGDTSIELFDLEADPGETTDVAESNPEVVDRIRSFMDEAHVPSEVFPLATIDTTPSNPDS